MNRYIKGRLGRSLEERMVWMVIKKGKAKFRREWIEKERKGVPR